MTAIKKGNPLKRNGIEEAFVRGLAKETVPLTKVKMNGGDVGYCPKKSVLLTLVDPEHREPVDPSGQLYMAQGSAIHKTYAKALEAEGKLLAEEYHVSHPRLGPPKFKPLSGYIDDIVITEEGEPAIIDAKTCGSLPHKIKSWHAEQVGVYALMSGIRRGYIHYVSRNVAGYDGKIIHRAFEIEMSDQFLMSIAYRLGVAHVYMNAETVPPIPLHIVSKNDCGFCPFQSLCWDGTTEIRFTSSTAEVELEDLELKAAKIGRILYKEMPMRWEETKAWLGKYGTDIARALYGAFG